MPVFLHLWEHGVQAFMEMFSLFKVPHLYKYQLTYSCLPSFFSLQRFYVVGSNNTEDIFRVLKIDRTEPRELQINDDKVCKLLPNIMNIG